MWTNSAIISERATALCPGYVTSLTISSAFALVSQIWTNFAINGEPGYGALPESRDRPCYLRCVAFISYNVQMWTDSAINSERVTVLCPGHATGLTISDALPVSYSLCGPILPSIESGLRRSALVT
jgi:hypothetical protein